jgi:hypothetical protein
MFCLWAQYKANSRVFDCFMSLDVVMKEKIREINPSDRLHLIKKLLVRFSFFLIKARFLLLKQ